MVAKMQALTERTAWELVRFLPEDRKFELVTVHASSLVLGPLLSPRRCRPARAIRRILERQIPALPEVAFPVVDVRDLAEAHIKALAAPCAAGQR